MKEQHLIDRAKAFVAAVAAAAPREAIEAFYAEDVIQEEFPNLLLPDGAVRDFINLRAAHDKTRYTIEQQSFEIVNAVASGNCVLLEIIWNATLAADLDPLTPGDRMRAQLAQVFEFRDGLIFRLRTYSCYVARHEIRPNSLA
ncbi:nuclear transport factor 2 family protein [Bradyrhizobium archetypum]|uniref:Nuclear transport factor 2 family protein n=1 Tax=Bradyrhizobium archetypum TaxID=2721160 RepID=A0A7Y4H6W6_9BRAD|nr:nuclear transport factor 2 family protein [Bradyrhizobium archetypum]NOJ48761.1 nuclear transport factor 2 family protein [Bradyrhizobium archetypum]